MRIIDFHTHIYPDRIAEKGSQSICDFYGLNSHYAGSATTLLDEGKKAGISEFVLLPVAIKPEQVSHINGFVAEQADEHKEFYGFGTLHAGMEDILSGIDEIEKLGLNGVKLHPDTQGFAIDDKRLYPAYDALSGRLPVLIHCGDPRYDFSRPEKLKKVLTEFPRLEVIAAHLGGWTLFDTALEYLVNEKCFFDISSCMMFLEKEQTERYINAYGADRVLFGTDFPLWSPSDEVKRFMSLSLTDSDKEKIAYKNALRILKRQV